MDDGARRARRAREARGRHHKTNVAARPAHLHARERRWACSFERKSPTFSVGEVEKPQVVARLARWTPSPSQRPRRRQRPPAHALGAGGGLLSGLAGCSKACLIALLSATVHNSAAWHNNIALTHAHAYNVMAAGPVVRASFWILIMCVCMATRGCGNATATCEVRGKSYLTQSHNKQRS
jgi:hypothetical protein